MTSNPTDSTPRRLTAGILCSLPFLLAPATHAVDVTESWIDRLDGPASMNDYGQAVAVAADGTTYVAGFVFEQVQQNRFAPRFMTVRYEADGTRAWTRTYAGTFSTGAAAAYHIAIDGKGDILVAGSTNEGDDWALVKYDPMGEEQWRTVYEANSTFLTEPEGMALDAAGNAYLVGYVGDGVNPDAGAIVKVTSGGTLAWAERYYGPSFDGGYFGAVAVDDAGDVYAAGAAVVPGLAGELAVVKYDADGVRQWLATDGSPGQTAYERATDVCIDGNGDIVVTGIYGFNTFAGLDIATLKLDAAGTRLWRMLYDGPDRFHDGSSAVAADSANNVVVVGYSGTDFDAYDALTLKYGPDGTFAWERRVAGDEILFFDWASGVAIDANDNVYVCGGYDPIGGERYFATRYAPDGTQDWFMDYAGPLGGGSRANAIAVGADGSVVVTGESPDVGTDFDIATIRYEQAGDPTPGDVNGDGVVNFGDVLAILAVWGPCQGCPEDLDGDGVAGFGDILVVLANWS